MSTSQRKHPLPVNPPHMAPTLRPPRLRPVPADYSPAYPSRLTPEEIHDLLRPGLFRRFTPTTMLAGALVAGAMAAGCDGPTPASGTGSDAGKSTRTDPQLRAKVDRIVEEVLGPVKDRKGWNE